MTDKFITVITHALFPDIPPPPDATEVYRWDTDRNGDNWHREFAGPTFIATGTPIECDCGCGETDDTAGTVRIFGVQFADGTTHRIIDTVEIRDDADAADACALAAALLNAADHLTQTHSPRTDAPTGLSGASNQVPEEFPQ